MLSFILAALCIALGAKAFTPAGLPLTKTKNLTGATAKIIGAACILLGLLLIADGLFASFSLYRLLGGGE